MTCFVDVRFNIPGKIVHIYRLDIDIDIDIL